MGKYSAFNVTRSAVLASDVVRAGSGWSRLKGLLGYSKRCFRPGMGLWIFPSNGIHTIGMRFPIDALYLDADCRVVRAYEGLKPWRIAAVSLRTQSVLELPAGTLGKCPTRVGDLMQFRPMGT